MNNIIDPNTLQGYSIFSNHGKHLLKKYINLYQTGGAAIEISPHMITNPPNLGPHSCISNALNILGYGNKEDIKKLQKHGLVFTCTQEPSSEIKMSNIIKIMNGIEDFIRTTQPERIIKEDGKISKEVHFKNIPMYSVFQPEIGLIDIKKKSKWMDILNKLYENVPEGYARAVVLTWNYMRSHIIVVAKKNDQKIIVDPQFKPKVFTGDEQVLKYLIKKNEAGHYQYPIKIEIIMSSLYLKSPIANKLKDIYDESSDSDSEMEKLRKTVQTKKPEPNKPGQTASFESEQSSSSSSDLDLDWMGGPTIATFVIPAVSKKAKTPKAKTPKAKTPKAKTPKAKTPKAKTPKAQTPKAKTPKAKA